MRLAGTGAAKRQDLSILPDWFSPFEENRFASTIPSQAKPTLLEN